MTENGTFLLFGTKTNDLEAARDVLSKELGLGFDRRDSSYFGGDYFLCRNAQPYAQSLKLHVNRDLIDGTPIYSHAPGTELILHADRVTAGNDLVTILAGLGFALVDRDETN